MAQGLTWVGKELDKQHKSIVIMLEDVRASSPAGHAPDGFCLGQRLAILHGGVVKQSLKLAVVRSTGSVAQIATPGLMDGAYEWRIPFSLPPGGDCRIKITLLYDPSVYDMSDAAFTIEANSSADGSRWNLY